MTKGKALTLGIVSLLPLAFMILFICIISNIIFNNPAPPNDRPPSFMFKLGPWIIIEVIALVVFYIIHIFKTSSIPDSQKKEWVIMLFLCHLGVIPFYWYFHVWKTIKPTLPA